MYKDDAFMIIVINFIEILFLPLVFFCCQWDVGDDNSICVVINLFIYFYVYLLIDIAAVIFIR